MTRPGRRVGRFLAVVLVLGGSFLATLQGGVSVAGADTTPSFISDQSGWYKGPSWDSSLPDPQGQCNMVYNLPEVDTTSHPWGFSEACEASIQTTPAGYPHGTNAAGNWSAGVFGGMMATDLPGVTCGADSSSLGGGNGCTNGPDWANDDDNAGEANLQPNYGIAGTSCNFYVSTTATCQMGGGISLMTDTNSCHDLSMNYADDNASSAHGGHDTYSNSTCGSSDYGTALSALSGCTVPILGNNFDTTCRDALSSDFNANTYSALAVNVVLECQYAYWNNGARTVTNGYEAISFRQNCWVPNFSDASGGYQVMYQAPGTTASDCAQNSGVVSGNDSANSYIGTTPQMFLSVESITCHAGTYLDAQMPATVWQGGTTDGGPCQDMVLTPAPTGKVAVTAGDTYRYSLSFSGGADYVEMDPGDHTSGTTTITGLPGTWPSDAQGQADPTSPVTFDLIPDTSGSFAPQVVCSAGGVTYGYSPPSYAAPGTVGNGFTCTSAGCYINLTQCLDNSGLGVSPSSWVPGLIADAGCLLTWAFVPHSIASSGLSDPFTTHFPGTLLVNFGTAAGTFFTALSGDAGGSACDAPDFTIPAISGITHSATTVNVPSPSDLGCTGPGDTTGGDLFGYRAPVLDVETFIVYAAGFFLVWKMMPWGNLTIPVFGDAQPGGAPPRPDPGWGGHGDNQQFPGFE